MKQMNPVWTDQKFVFEDAVFPVHIVCLSRPKAEATKSDPDIIGHFSIDKSHITKKDEPITRWFFLEDSVSASTGEPQKARICIEIIGSGFSD